MDISKKLHSYESWKEGREPDDSPLPRVSVIRQTSLDDHLNATAVDNLLTPKSPRWTSPFSGARWFGAVSVHQSCRGEQKIRALSSENRHWQPLLVLLCLDMIIAFNAYKCVEL